MVFKMTHLIFTEAAPTMFSNLKPPLWLMGREHLWWYKKHVLTLKVGQSIDSDFQRITRVA